jgi:hypothetical protein
MTREEKRQARRGRRITFLVNIWLNYKPLNVEPFPETMLEMMSGSSHNFQSSCSESSALKRAPAAVSALSAPACPPAPAPRPCLRFGQLSGEDASNEPQDIVETTYVTITNGKVVMVAPSHQEANKNRQPDETHDDDHSTVDKTAVPASIVQTFTWPMGSDDSGESLQMQIPLSLVQEHQAQLDTNTTTAPTNRRRPRRRGGNIHIHYVPSASTSMSSSTPGDPTVIINRGVVLLKNDDGNDNFSSIDDSQQQPREKRRTPSDEDDNDNGNPHSAKRSHSDNYHNKS